MDISNWGWKRKEQEYPSGDYHFNGQALVTRTIHSELEQAEIMAIIADAINLAKEKGGIDYLLVYEHEEKEKIFVIDQVTKSDLESGLQPPKHNYFTVLFASEY